MARSSPSPRLPRGAGLTRRAQGAKIAAMSHQTMIGQIEQVEAIASICHEANAAYCTALGDFSQLPWSHAPKWQKESVRHGVQAALADPNATPETQHENWLAEKVAQGWVYGPEKNVKEKTHPCCVPYAMLPEAQRRKDVLFLAIVRALASGC